MPCTDAVAVAALKRVSQVTNRKLYDVASVITTAASRGKPVPADLMDALAEVMPPQARHVRAGASQTS